MKIEIEHAGPIAVVRLSGELTGDQSQKLVEELHSLAAGPNARMAIDLSALELIDSSGLNALIGLVCRARLSESRIILVAPPPFVEGVFSVTRLDSWFETAGSIGEAARHLSEE